MFGDNKGVNNGPIYCNSGILSFTKAAGDMNWHVRSEAFIEFNEIMKLNMGSYNYIYGCGGYGSNAAT
jgi:hypothetical protein